MPGAYDLLAPAISAFERKTETPRDPAGALYGPKNGGQVRGDYPGPVFRSAYTRAGLNPVTTTLLATGATVAAALFLGRRR